MSELVPKTAKTLLDLGCGTGLELDEMMKLILYSGILWVKNQLRE